MIEFLYLPHQVLMKVFVMIIGIDIGGSTTKIVGFEGNNLIAPLNVSASDPVTSASGALGKFLDTNSVEFSQIDNVVITGVGASFVKPSLLGLQVEKADEFHAVGLGGLYLSGLSEAIVVSMGTGTAFVKAHGKCIKHLGGTGVGGGTLTGLAKSMLNTKDFNSIIELAKKGDVSKIDLSVGDISHINIENLPSQITASNFGKMSDDASKNDIAAGIINMVFQTIGMLSIFAARAQKDRHIIMTGNLVKIPQSRDIFNELSELFEVSFHFPEYAQYATAIGAAISKKINRFL